MIEWSRMANVVTTVHCFVLVSVKFWYPQTGLIDECFYLTVRQVKTMRWFLGSLCDKLVYPRKCERQKSKPVFCLCVRDTPPSLWPEHGLPLERSYRPQPEGRNFL